jgi:hypothetical protein
MVDAIAERQVATKVPGDVEPVRVGELHLVAVGG